MNGDYMMGGILGAAYKTALFFSVWLIFLSSDPLAASAISFDAVSSSTNNNTSRSVTWSHRTDDDSNRAMLVCTQTRSTVQASVLVSSVTYGGAALTFVRGDTRRDTTGIYFRTEQWVKANPASGTNNVVVTWAGAPTNGYAVGTATTYSGVYGTPVDAASGGNGQGTALSVNIITATANDWIADCAIGRGDNNMTARVGGNQTIRTNRLTGLPTPADIVMVSTVNGKATAGMETMDWTQNGSSDWVTSAVALKPAVSIPTTRRIILGSDNFLRPDNIELGPNWEHGYSGHTNVAIVSNQVRSAVMNVSDPKSVELYTAAAPGNDQFCQITLPVFQGPIDREYGCIVRAKAPPTIGWYWCYARKNGARNAAIVVHNAGGVGNANLASDFTTVWGSGDKLICEADDTELRLFRIPAGSTIETRLLTATDSRYKSGKTGLVLWMATGGTLSNATADSFIMGTLQ
jgi:hypothetical protein